MSEPAGRPSAAAHVGQAARRAVLYFAVLVSAFAPRLALADVYGFVDALGATHFATEALDDRYQLFFREGVNAQERPAGPFLPTDGALMRTRLFQRLVDQPNVAKYEPLIANAARAAGEDPALIKSMIAVESAFDAAAVSPKGAVGLMQVLPETAERYGLTADRHRTVAQQLCEPAVNLRIGTRYLKDLRQMFGDLGLALAAYNAGENSVRRFNNQVPPFPETVNYVKVVQQFLAFYRPERTTQAPSGRLHVVFPARQQMPAPLMQTTAPTPLAFPADEAQVELAP